MRCIHSSRNRSDPRRRSNRSSASQSPGHGCGRMAIALLAVLFLAGYLPKRHRAALLAAEADGLKHAVPRVALITPRLGKGERALSLSATLEGLEQTDVDARANGYVRRWLVDLGDSV